MLKMATINKICNWYQYGQCKLGNKCIYKHKNPLLPKPLECIKIYHYSAYARDEGHKKLSYIIYTYDYKNFAQLYQNKYYKIYNISRNNWDYSMREKIYEQRKHFQQIKKIRFLIRLLPLDIINIIIAYMEISFNTYYKYICTSGN